MPFAGSVFSLRLGHPRLRHSTSIQNPEPSASDPCLVALDWAFGGLAASKCPAPRPNQRLESSLEGPGRLKKAQGLAQRISICLSHQAWLWPASTGAAAKGKHLQIESSRVGSGLDRDKLAADENEKVSPTDIH